MSKEAPENTLIEEEIQESKKVASGMDEYEARAREWARRFVRRLGEEVMEPIIQKRAEADRLRHNPDTFEEGSRLYREAANDVMLAQQAAYNERQESEGE